ncbi:MAG: hypothetical protein QOE45_2734 [Frankiaceae bacterium]|jgi:hypothetical protein|nr:hypothetical protein [Frankiaceae bacterium]
MRRSASAVLLAVLAMGSVAVPSQAQAADLFGCSARQEGGDATTRCFYVAASTHGRIVVNEVEGYIIGFIGCDHSPGVRQDHSGSADFAQIPGDLCHVTMVVETTSGTGDVWGGSVL